MRFGRIVEIPCGVGQTFGEIARVQQIHRKVIAPLMSLAQSQDEEQTNTENNDEGDQAFTTHHEPLTEAPG